MVQTMHWRSWKRTIAAISFSLAVILQLAACGVSHIQTLREAEQTFSRAAELDNRERLDATAAAAVAGGAASGYRVAEKLAGELIAGNSNELRQDNLLCTAYLIEALSLWRLGEQDAAVRVAEQGKDCAQAASRDAVPRDRALLYAVPGLVRIDQANALALNATASEEEFDRAKTEIVRALTILEEAEAMISPDHPVRGYLMYSRLAALRGWQVAITREKLADPRRGQELVAFNEQAKKTWLAYRYFTKCQLDREGDPSVEKWRVLLGLEAPRQPVACDQPPDK
jgi:hypothetical protein